jgi:molybdopterin molybdotransferase
MSEPDVSDLISVDEAIAILDAVKVSPRLEEVSLDAADGRVLAEDLRADRDAPPFRKSQMDGFAVRCADIANVPVALQISGEIPAGTQSTQALRAGEAMAITGGR